MKKFMSEFKEFISRGSVMDLAVGMIIGAAFTAIVTSLVDDIIMPIISLVSGGIDVSQMGIHLAGGGVIAIKLCRCNHQLYYHRFRNLLHRESTEQSAEHG